MISASTRAWADVLSEGRYPASSLSYAEYDRMIPIIAIVKTIPAIAAITSNNLSFLMALHWNMQTNILLLAYLVHLFRNFVPGTG